MGQHQYSSVPETIGHYASLMATKAISSQILVLPMRIQNGIPTSVKTNVLSLDNVVQFAPIYALLPQKETLRLNL